LAVFNVSLSSKNACKSSKTYLQ